MSESQLEMRAIKQHLRLYQVNSHPPSQNVANRSIHPFSERLASERLTVVQPQRDRVSASTGLATPPVRQPQTEQTPQASSLPTRSPQARPPQVDLPQIELPPVPTANPPHTNLSNPPDLEADIDWEPVRPVAQTRSIAADRLQQKSVQYLQQFVQPTPDQANLQLDSALKRLEAQAQHINELSVTQETAILELKAIAQQIERDWKTLEVVNAARAGYDAANIDIPAVCKYSPIRVPLVEKNEAGVLVLSERSLDLFKAEREAAMTAQSLRFRTAPTVNPRASWTRKLRQLLVGSSKTATIPGPREQSHAAAQARMHRRKSRSLSFREGMSLLFGAVLVRVLLNLLLSAHPAFWFPAIALMVMPGAIAVYRSRVTPKLTLTWGYRLIFIMIGFLIGGRL